MSKSTPTPWSVKTNMTYIEIDAGTGCPVVSWPGFDDSNRSYQEHVANAALIVRAVNAHDALVEACKLMVYNEGQADELRDSGMVDNVDIKVIRACAERARKALKLAESPSA